jgi:hypothetical protein
MPDQDCAIAPTVSVSDTTHPGARVDAVARLRTRLQTRLQTRLDARRAEGGAAVVEFALILPILILLLFGTVDVAFILNDTTKLRSAVRETGRRAALGTSEYGQQICPLTGATFTTVGRRVESTKILCLSKFYGLDSGGLNVRSATRVYTFAADGTPSASRNQNFDEGNGLVVCGQIESKSRTKLLSSMLDGKIIKSKVVMRIASPVTNGPGEAQETSLPGGNWSWCNAS